MLSIVYPLFPDISLNVVISLLLFFPILPELSASYFGLYSKQCLPEHGQIILFYLCFLITVSEGYLLLVFIQSVISVPVFNILDSHACCTCLFHSQGQFTISRYLSHLHSQFLLLYIYFICKDWCLCFGIAPRIR